MSNRMTAAFEDMAHLEFKEILDDLTDTEREEVAKAKSGPAYFARKVIEFVEKHKSPSPNLNAALKSFIVTMRNRS